MKLPVSWFHIIHLFISGMDNKKWGKTIKTFLPINLDMTSFLYNNKKGECKNTLTLILGIIFVYVVDLVENISLWKTNNLLNFLECKFMQLRLNLDYCILDYCNLRKHWSMRFKSFAIILHWINFHLHAQNWIKTKWID